MNDKDEIKKNGIFYTPPELAKFVADYAIKKADTTVLDPCYGEGALLIAAYNRLLALGSSHPEEQLDGYDILSFENEDAPKILFNLFKKNKLVKKDFFFPVDDGYENKKFDCIIMNPPFVRHHLIPNNVKHKIRKCISNDVTLSKTSALWVYFVIHSLRFIRIGGNLAVLLPWSFLYSDFAKKTREILLKKFRVLKVVIIGRRLFEKSQERVLVFIGENLGSPTKNIKFSHSFDVPRGKINWRLINRQKWRKLPWSSIVDDDIQKIFSNIEKKLDLRPLENFAKIRIGVVTGANDFFILKKDYAEQKVPKQVMKPIVKNSKLLNNLTISNSDINDVILMIPENMNMLKPLEEYIKSGVQQGLDRGYHTKRRSKWYSIPYNEPPDAFLHYMTKEIPFIVLNPDGIFSTNAIHEVHFFKDIDENTQKWIQFSMFTSISQLSIELQGRTYGGGILKLEPSAAKKILVYTGNGLPFPKNLYNQLNELLIEGKKREAMNLADKWMTTNLEFLKRDLESIAEYYEKIKSIRLGDIA